MVDGLRDTFDRAHPLVMDEWLARYAPSALLFVREVLGAEPEPWQEEVLRQYDADRTLSVDGVLRIRESYFVRISIASGHGVGKTALLSWLIVHHAATLYPQKTAVTAPSSNQLWDALWPETKIWINRLPTQISSLFEPKSERIELISDPAGSFISAKAARKDQPEALAGVHSDFVLLILDEFSGIPDAVIESASGSMSGRRVAMVGAGNPLRGSGYFFDTHHKLSKEWRHYTVSVFDSKFASKDFAQMIETRYGKDSNQYRVRVLGLFPETDDDVIIPMELVESAIGRDVTAPKVSSVVWGLDVAFMGGNRTALAKRRANVLLEPPKAWGGLDDAQVAGRIMLEWENTIKDDRPADINVDCIGYGAAVSTRLKALGLPARCINVSESPAFKNSMYRNLKAELWAKGREWFFHRDVQIPLRDKDGVMEDFIEEITTARWKPQPVSGKILVNPKKSEISPDLADAFILTFASESFVLSGIEDAYRNWKKPLNNPIKGIV